MMKEYLLYFLLFLSAKDCFTQNQKIADSLKHQLHLSNDDSLKSLLMGRIGYYLHDIKPDSALYYATEGLKLGKQINYQKGVGACYYAIAYYYWINGLYRKSLDFALQSLKISETYSEDLSTLADNYLLIGNIYAYTPDLLNAKLFYKKTLLIREKIGDFETIWKSLNNLGYIFVQLKNYDSATHFLQRALAINRKNNYSKGIAFNLSNLAEISVQRRDYALAKKQMSESIRVNESVGDNRLQSRNYNELAKIYSLTNNVPLAVQNATKAFKLAETIGLAFEKKNAAFTLYELSLMQHKMAAALEFYKIYAHVEDSLNRSRMSSELDLLRKNYELVKKDAEIKILQQSNELKEIELTASAERMRFQAMLIVFIASLVILLSFSIYSLLQKYKLKKDYSELLEVTNKTIQLQNEEIKSQSEELHSLNEQLSIVNDSLEQKVHDRTQRLEKQNSQLTEYAFYNSHKLRGPLASILGLINLFENGHIAKDEFLTVLKKLKVAANDMDQVVSEINKILDVDADVDSI